jgi:hypothetical protein
MRLKNVEKGHRLPQKILLGLIRLKLGERAPDVLRTAMYRPEFFGRNYGAYIQDVMRGSSEWSVGERELFAAFVSKKNSCSF